jgi:cytochrome c1
MRDIGTIRARFKCELPLTDEEYAALEAWIKEQQESDIRAGTWAMGFLLAFFVVLIVISFVK